MTLFSILQILILQIMDRPCQLSERTGPNRIFSFLKVSYCALRKPGFARKTLRGKFFCCCPDFLQIFRVDYSLVLAASLTRPRRSNQMLLKAALRRIGMG
jgi:hypothetical protein